MTRAIRAWGPFLLWAGLLFLLSGIQSVPSGPRVPHLDKVGHFILYSVVGGTLAWGRWSWDSRLPHWIPLFAGYTYGALDEWHQSFVPGRSPELADWVADVLGVTVGYTLLTLRLARRRSREAASPPRGPRSTGALRTPDPSDRTTRR